VRRQRRNELANWLGVILSAISIAVSATALWLVLR
jgi:hypothetical protein